MPGGLRRSLAAGGDRDGDPLRTHWTAGHLASFLRPQEARDGSCGTHSPWISRLLQAQGHRVVVANARKLRAISQSARKSDEADAQLLARLCRADAERAKERVSIQPGFSDRLDGFGIDEYEIGKDHWTEGFVTIHPDEA